MEHNLRYVYQYTIVAAVGGFLFGYDTAVISGAIGFIEKKFQLSAAMTGWAASCALIGCMLGALFAGWLSDRFGRKKVLLLAAVAFAVSSLGILPHWGLTAFVGFRLIGGIGIGIASIVSPMYISEIAPANIRGRLIAIYQMGIVLGILIIYFVNAIIAGMYDEAWNIEKGWRWMFGSGLAPSLIFVFLLLVVPESPRWLAKQNLWEKAAGVLSRVSGAKASEELDSIKASLALRQGNLTDLLKPGLRKALIIGICLSVFSQVTGINVIMYYAPEIFKSTGDGSSSAFMQTVLVGCINALMTVVAIRYVDKLGRKKLLLTGSAGMAVCLAMVGFAFYSNMTAGYWVLTGILLYICFFAVSLGPLTFVVVSEIFPTRLRGRAMSIAIFFLWLSVYIVSQTFPMLLEAIGGAFTFWIYMAMSVLAFLFVWLMVPETKEKSLEEIELMWKIH